MLRGLRPTGASGIAASSGSDRSSQLPEASARFDRLTLAQLGLITSHRDLDHLPALRVHGELTSTTHCGRPVSRSIFSWSLP